MKKIGLSTMLIAMLMVFSSNISAQKGTEEAEKNLKAYDKVLIGGGMERYVIYVDPKADESQLSIELIGGKTILADCNRHILMGKFEKHTVEGWGYDYYVFETKGNIASTMMACPNSSKTEKFVTAEGLNIRYNSRLPIVVYLPKEYGLNYRIWTAGENHKADKQ